MVQDIKTYRIGKYDREKFQNEKIKKLNEDGWKVISFSYPDDNHVAFLAYKPEPPITITVPTEEDLDTDDEDNV